MRLNWRCLRREQRKTRKSKIFYWFPSGYFFSFAKDLKKHLKMVKPDKQVMIIGCLNQCDFKKINKKNVKAIFKGDRNKYYFPCPDYGTRR